MVRQRKSRGLARTKAKANYRKNKTRNKLRARVWRQRNKSRIKITRRRYKQNPNAHKRIASELEQELVFSFGLQEIPGIVVDVTPYGIVLFELFELEEDLEIGDDDGDTLPCSLPLDAFLDVATFDSDEDRSLFFMWADEALESEDA